jgi:hypothetical protein
MKRAFILTQMRVEVAAKIRETRDDSIITAFILVSDPADCARFLNRSREGALMAARYHFIHLLDKQLNQLARAAGNYFAEQIIAKLILDGGHE